MNEDEDDDEEEGLIRHFVKGTYDRLQACANCIGGNDLALLTTQIEPSGWTSLTEPLNCLGKASKKLRGSDQTDFEEAMRNLEAFLLTHHVHFMTAAFRKLENPLQFTFNILTCSLGLFLERCNASYMASIGKTAYLAIIEKEQISLSGTHLLAALKTKEEDGIPSMGAFSLYFKRDMEKVIFF